METDLIRRAQKGDQDAFREIVEQYASVTERTARVLMQQYSRPEAEDAVQEAWLDAWRGLSRFDLERPFRPWILTLLANRCRMVARKKSLPTLPYDAHSDVEDSLATELYTVGKPRDEELEGALTQLEESQRQVIALRFYADLSLEEIAEVTGAPLGTVKSRLHRALARLREWLTHLHPISEKEVRP